jgi:autotransporter-associated beta strand protein
MAWQRLSAVIGTAALFLTGAPRLDAVESTWTSTLSTGAWNDAANWSGGAVPSAAGDVARFPNPTAASTNAGLAGPITLGRLVFENSDRTVTLSSVGPLIFDNAAAGAAQILYGSLTATAKNTISVPVQIADAQGLLVNLASATSALDLTAGITSSSGNLTKQGSGSLRIAGSSTGWTGKLVVDQGTVRIDGAPALGESSNGVLVNSQGTLHLYRNTDLENEPVELAGGQLSAESFSSQVPSILSTLTVTADSRIVSTGTFELMGRITGAGGIAYSGTQANVRGDNDYAGATRIQSGRVNVYTPTALGTSAQGTIVETGGQLIILAATSEPIAVRGGTLNLNSAAAATGQITLQSGSVNLFSNQNYTAPIILDQATSNATIAGSNVTLTGGVTGTGHLKLGGQLNVNGASLAHTGDLATSATLIRLKSPNSFGGNLIVTGGTTHVDHAQAVGSAGNEMHVRSGVLSLNEQVVRTTRIERGELVLNRNDFQFDAPIFMASGIVQNHGVISGPIVLQGTTLAAPRLVGGLVSGVISGASNLDLSGRSDSALTLTGQNSFAGVALVNGSSTVVNANSSSALGTTDWATVVESGTLNINVSTDEKLFVSGAGKINLNAPVKHVPKMLSSPSTLQPSSLVNVAVPMQFEGPANVAGGTLEINANTSVEGLSVVNRGRVTVASGKTLQVNAPEIDLRSGRIEGAVTGNATIRKTTKGGAQLGAMPSFTGQVIVENGVLEVFENSLSSPAGATTVSGSGQLMTRGTFGISDPIYLDNAAGPLNRGGMNIGPVCCGQSKIIMNNILHLGSQGSIIGGGGNAREAQLWLYGDVRGGALTVNGSGALVRFLNPNNSFTGVTDVYNGYIELAGNGRLTTTSAIILREGRGSSFESVLVIDNLESGAGVDHIAASVPIELRGGTIQAYGSGSEAFGKLVFAEGDSVITSSMPLSAQRIERSPGATAFLDLSAPMPVAEAPANVGGLVPWMAARTAPVNQGPYYDRFAEYVNGQLRSLSSASIISNINAATANSNVGLAGGVTATATADRTVKSLMMENGSSLQLGGHTLTVASGGIIHGAIHNGNIVPGADSGGELIFSQSAQIHANVIDGPAGPTSLTISGGGGLTGNNTFTGRLALAGSNSTISSEAAIPANIDFDIVGGDVRLFYTATATKHLGRWRLTGDAEFGGNGRFSFDEMILESGRMYPGQLHGSGVIRKTTIGSVDLGIEDASTYNGQVIVEEGFLFSPYLKLASYRIDGGRLQLFEGANAIQLNGGELEFLYLTGPIQVTAPSTLISMDSSSARNRGLAGPISGSARLTFDSNEAFYDSSGGPPSTFSISRDNSGFTGEVAIRSADVGVSHNKALGSGPITIHDGGRLRVGSVELASPLVLDGGTLRGDGSSSRVIGPLTVLSPSSIGELNVLGHVDLTHGAPLITSNEGPTRFLGQLRVGVASELSLGRLEGGRRGLVEIGGTIAAAAPASALNIVRGGLDDLAFTASLQIDAGKSLKVLIDGELNALKLGAGQTVSGGGSLENPVEFGAGGVVSPGSSPGILSLADATIAGGATYLWEFNDLQAQAGGPTGWDLLNVDGQLSFTATPQAPWKLKVVGLPGTPIPVPPLETASWLIAEADSLVGFDPGAILIEKPATGVGSQGVYKVTASDGRLLLTYQIPEPTSAVALAVTAALGVVEGRRRARAGQ